MARRRVSKTMSELHATALACYHCGGVGWLGVPDEICNECGGEGLPAKPAPVTEKDPDEDVDDGIF